MAIDEIKAALVGGDPIAREAGLSAADADAMRRVVVAAARAAQANPAPWPGPLALAVTLAVTIAVGIAFGTGPLRTRGQATTSRSLRATATPATTQLADRRQLQFSTPGGTRIIWVFDPAFNP